MCVCVYTYVCVFYTSPLRLPPLGKGQRQLYYGHAIWAISPRPLVRVQSFLPSVGSVLPWGWGQFFCYSGHWGTGPALPQPAQHDPQTYMIPMSSCGNMGYRDQHRPQLLSPRCYQGCNNSAHHWDKHDPGCIMTLGHQHDLRVLTRPRVSAWPLVVSGVRGINSDFIDYYKATGPEVFLGSSLGQGVTMAPGGSANHSDCYGPSGGLALRHQHRHKWWPKPKHPCGFWWQHRPCISTQTLAATGLWTQTCSSAAARPGCHHDPGWQRRPLRPVYRFTQLQTATTTRFKAIDQTQSSNSEWLWHITLTIRSTGQKIKKY